MIRNSVPTRRASLRAAFSGLAAFLAAATLLAAPAAGTTGPAPATARPASQSVPTPDVNWQVGGVTNAVVRSVAMTSTTIYLAGNFTTVRPSGLAANSTSQNVSRKNVAAFDRKTGALLSWNPAPNGQVYSIVAAGTHVYLGGQFTQVAGKAASRFAAVWTSNGTLDSQINVAANAPIYVIRNGPNGNLFLGGNFSQINKQPRSRIAEITPAGQLVTAWHPTIKQYFGDTTQCPPRCHPEVLTIDFSSDGGTVYVGGHFGLVNGVQRNEGAAVRLNDSAGCTTASCVLPWNPSVFAPRNCPTCKMVETSRIYTIHVTGTKVIACGGFWRVNYSPSQTKAVTRYNIAAFNTTDGTVVARSQFDAEDDGDTPGCALRDNVLYIGGHFNYVGAPCPCNSTNSATRHHVAAVDATAGALLPWNPTTNSFHGVYTISADSGSVAFGGYFTKMGGANQQGFASYSSSLP